MRCPKCSHEQEQTKTCENCEVIFSKYYAAQKKNLFQSKISEKEENPLNSDNPEMLEKIMPGHPMSPLNLERNPFQKNLLLNSQPWNPIRTPTMIVLSLGFLALFYLLANQDVMAPAEDSIILYFLHEANLIFHEAGHAIFQIFGRTIHILGGALGQVLVPLMVGGYFWARWDTAEFAFSLVWVFENFIDVAFYIADARALSSPYRWAGQE